MDKKKEEEKEIIEEDLDQVVEQDASGDTGKEEKDDSKELLDRIDGLEKELSELKDKMLRQAAETENYRKRLLKDKENAVKFANEAMVKDLLDPLDNFSRAIRSANENKDFDGLKSGISMVEDQLLSILRTNWGLEPIDAEGKPFDPSEMEAYAAEEQEGLEEETVLMVFQQGYKLHGKVIRSAKVKVGKPKA